MQRQREVETFVRTHCAILVLAARSGDRCRAGATARLAALDRATDRIAGQRAREPGGRNGRCDRRAGSLPPGARIIHDGRREGHDHLRARMPRRALARTGGTSFARRPNVSLQRRRRWARPLPLPSSPGPQVVNTGGSVVRGDLGVSPGTAVVGFPGGKVVDGTIQTTGEAPNLAQKDAAKAYRRSRKPAVQRQVGRAGPRRADAHAGRLLFSGRRRNADRRARAGRPGRSRRGLHLSGRDHADDGGRVVDARDQQRSGCRSRAPSGGRAATRLALPRVLAGRRFGHASAGTAPSSAPSSRRTASTWRPTPPSTAATLARTGDVTLDSDAIEIPQCVMPLRVLGRSARPATVGVVGAGVGAPTKS